MPDFTYEALANTGGRNQGTMTANSKHEVMSMLDARGLFPLRIDLVKTAAIGLPGLGAGDRQARPSFRCSTRRSK